MTLLLSFLIFLLLVAGMAVGVIFANKPIKGSCGGLSTIGLQSACVICGGSNKPQIPEADDGSEPFYDATRQA